MIEDPELRSLFQTECEEYLQQLESGLLFLEKCPTDTQALEEAFRTVHSLKGSAGMLGISSITAIAHRMEDTLDDARDGVVILSPEEADRMYRALDAIRAFVHEAVTGAPAAIAVAEVLRQLDGGSPASPTVPGPSPGPGPEPDPVSSPIADSQADASPAPVAEAAAAPFPGMTEPPHAGQEAVPPGRTLPEPAGGPEAKAAPRRGPEAHKPVSAADALDLSRTATMRVKPQQLDALMRLSGELAVTTTQVARRFDDLEEIRTLWEEWNREMVLDRYRYRPAGLSFHDEAASAPAARQGSERDIFEERHRANFERLGALLNRQVRLCRADGARLEFIANEISDRICSTRLMPLSAIFNLFPRLVRDQGRVQGKQVQLIVEGGQTTVDKRILDEMKDPLMHLIRNAIDHGIEAPEERRRGGKPETASVWLKASRTATAVVVEVGDDGRGLESKAIGQAALAAGLCRAEELAKMSEEEVYGLIFRGGCSTSDFVTDISGRGVGLDVVRRKVEQLKGSVEIHSEPGRGCTFRLSLPGNLATVQVLLVEAGGRTFALPMEYVNQCRFVTPSEIFPVDGRSTVLLDKIPTSVAALGDLLEIGRAKAEKESPSGKPKNRRLACVFLTVGREQFGLLVDDLADEQEVVSKPLGGLLERVRNVHGATILNTGEICLILNPHDLLKTLRRKETPLAEEPPGEVPELERKLRILLAEDSITTRTQEKRILEGAGYEVVTAVDGLDAFNKLASEPFDALVSDIQMPNLDGLALAEKVRQNKQYGELPIILVTSLASDEDKRKGIQVGANAYLVKPTFDQKVLLDTLRRLV